MTEEIFKLLKKLSETPGPVGREDRFPEIEEVFHESADSRRSDS